MLFNYQEIYYQIIGIVRLIVAQTLKCKRLQSISNNIRLQLAAQAQMVARLPLVQQVRGSIPDGVVNFELRG